MSDTPIRVFIGTEPKTEIARKVLEFSIRRRTRSPVEFTPMIGEHWEYSIEGIAVGTGFSLRRWMIPQRCGWEGRAIYLDADQLVMGDIAELAAFADSIRDKPYSAWMTYQPDKFSSKPWPQSSVMVIDCAAAKNLWGWHIEQVLSHLRGKPDRRAYADLMHCTWMDTLPGRIPVEWNHLNTYEKGKSKLVHYTSEPQQPWYAPEHAHAQLWRAELEAAIRAGCVSREEFQTALGRFGVREDWRKTNGLHPDYAKLLPLFQL